MKVGITYDLRDDYIAQGCSVEEAAEFDSAETICAIESTLESLGYRTERIGHVRALVAALAAGKRWDIVFNIAEGRFGSGREAQVPALLDAFQIPYTFSDPLTLCATLDKSVAKLMVREAGVPTPDFTVCYSERDLRQVGLPLPLFVKPLSGGTGMGVTPASRITSRDQLVAVGTKLIKHFDQPVLVESYLPGREFTVGVAGTGMNARCLAVMEVILKKGADDSVYSFRNKEECESLVEYRLVQGELAEQAAWTAVTAYRALRCLDAGRVDLRADPAGTIAFIEVNPLAGLHPTHSDLPILCSLAGIEYREILDTIMGSALHRYGMHRPAARHAG
ncbi:MAG: ATP-grasp domain-containing protein [Thermodesulfobacteriota bacterium]